MATSAAATPVASGCNHAAAGIDQKGTIPRRPNASTALGGAVARPVTGRALPGAPDGGERSLAAKA